MLTKYLPTLFYPQDRLNGIESEGMNMKRLIKNLIFASVSFVFTFFMTQNAMADYDPASMQVLRDAVIGAMTGAIATAETSVQPVSAINNLYSPYWYEGRYEAGKLERRKRDFDEKIEASHRDERLMEIRETDEKFSGVRNRDVEWSA